MKISKLLLLSVVVFSAALISSCMKEEVAADNSSATKDEGFPTAAQLEDYQLGRVLFYDKRLSVNNTISCASCHKQSKAFSDDQALSKGFDGRLTTRNSLPIQNIGNFRFDSGLIFEEFPRKLFWDGRDSILSEMVLRPIANHVEMGIPSMDYLVDKVSALPYYPPLFEKLFESTEITSYKIGLALSSFLSSLSSFQSKFDRSELNATEQYGLQLFITKYPCNECHSISEGPGGYGSPRDTMTNTFRSIGLDVNSPDPGFGAVTGRDSDMGKFRVPSLRNVALTAPYMHDGRFRTLGEVMDHYSTSIRPHSNLDPSLKDQDGHPLIMDITEQEKEAMIAFLSTLTDFSFINDPELSDPFN